MVLGFLIAVYCGFWAVVDFAILNEANSRVRQEALKSSSPKADYLYNRELAHRINVFAEGVWALGGTILYINSLALLKAASTKDKD